MSFNSILYPDDYPAEPLADNGPPGYFHDLNLDQLIAVLTEGREEYHLAPVFYHRETSADVVRYRQAIMDDVREPAVNALIKTFARDMQGLRDILAKNAKRGYLHNQTRWHLTAVTRYSAAIDALGEGLSAVVPRSAGLRHFSDYVRAYRQSTAYRELCRRASALTATLSRLRYSLLIRGNTIDIDRDDDPVNYSEEILHLFQAFVATSAQDRLKVPPVPAEMNHIEGEILDCLARLYHDEFTELAAFYHDYAEFIPKTFARFDKEIQFYVCYADFMDRLIKTGLPFCRPEIATDSKAIFCHDGFDAMLAWNLIAKDMAVVGNDFSLNGNERIGVITGPNQGGKTTFARMVGQLHHLTAIGCPVPGRQARLLLCDNIFTQFEKSERVVNLHGKLEEDLLGIQRILADSTASSLIILNEVFNSTTAKDAVFLGGKVIEGILARGALAVYVTFIDELTAISDKVVSMMSLMADSERRSFKICRKAADGRAFSRTLVEKYGLTYEILSQRLASCNPI
ncbi:MutS-related protein [Martelella alba]|uniref:DNA mismatch repair protein MutS n=1 Tax=Martelella alba TaxID=2590451 RepID=A0ABY2SPB6_9HYPH|nr:DNA mismatch repair protein MutS [Martelella alba]TKI07842.1 DNA mismatch repair protein MutS [Martelella alba]